MTNVIKPKLEWHTVHLEIEDDVVHWASEKPARRDELFIENGHYEIRKDADGNHYTEPRILRERPRGPRGGNRGFETVDFATVAEAQAAIEAWRNDQERKANAVANREKRVAERSVRMLKADARHFRDEMLEEIELMENAEDAEAPEEFEYYKSRFVHARRELQDAIIVYEARCSSEGVPSMDVMLDDLRKVQVDGATRAQVGAWKMMQADRERRLRDSPIDALELDMDERRLSIATSATDASSWEVVGEGSAIGRFGRLAFGIDPVDGESQLIVQPNLEEWPIAEVLDAPDDIYEHMTRRTIGNFESVEAAQIAAEKLVTQGYQIPLTNESASDNSSRARSGTPDRASWWQRVGALLGKVLSTSNISLQGIGQRHRRNVDANDS